MSDSILFEVINNKVFRISQVEQNLSKEEVDKDSATCLKSPRTHFRRNDHAEDSLYRKTVYLSAR